MEIEEDGDEELINHSKPLPPRWDLIAAAMTYLEGRVWDLDLE
ncbi:hypothetical protein MY8738_005716 [Beauveria namnaoensis]